MPPSKISVVIPLYNKARHIRRAVDSVLNQSFQDFELVVVDDGSGDGGGAIVGAIADPRIRLIRQDNAGVSAARNRGIREARHDLIAFLDADDGYNPRFLEVILGLAGKYESAGAYGTAWLDGIVRRAWSLRESGAEDALIHDYFRDALSGPVIWSSATAVPKRTFDEVGGFPVGVRRGEDLDTWLRIGARFPVAVSAYVGSVYYRDADNRTDAVVDRAVEYELVKTGLRLLPSLPLDDGRRKHLREYVARYQITAACHMVLLGQHDRARTALLEIRTTRAVLRKWWYLLWTFIPTPLATAAELIVRRARGETAA